MNIFRAKSSLETLNCFFRNSRFIHTQSQNINSQNISFMSGNQSILLESGRSWFEIESLFKKKPATIKCSNIKSDELSKHQNLQRVHLPGNFADMQPYYKISKFNYHSLRQVLLRSGFKRSPMPPSVANELQEPELQPGLIQRDSQRSLEEAMQHMKMHIADPRYPWNFFWGRHLPGHMYKFFNPFQKSNHFPGTTTIGRKDDMAHNLIRMENRLQWREDEVFYPKTFDLPTQRNLLIQDMHQNPTKKYIVKPSNSSCGRGIYIISSGEFTKIPARDAGSFVVQHYIDNPHLINGLKYDLRLYVGVSSFNPLKVYLFADGLTRFATEKYSNNLTNVFSQLTNYSINKYSSSFIKNEDEDDDSCGNKWSIRALKEYYETQGIDHHKMWKDVEEIIVKTLISCEDIVNTKTSKFMNENHDNCFEFFGFDIMFDDNLKPWLIEVNLLPSLSIPTPIDKKIKLNALGQMFDIVGLHAYNRSKLEEEVERCFHFVNGYEPFSSITGRKMSISTEHQSSLLNGEKIFTPKQRFIIQNAEDELHRKGHYKRIYPPIEDDVRKYDKCFIETNPNNETLIQWEEFKQSQLSQGKALKQILSLIDN